MRIRRWKNPGFSQRSENFENACIMLQKIIEYLNRIKRYSGKIFIKFERDEGSFENSCYVCSIRISLNFGRSLLQTTSVVHDRFVAGGTQNSEIVT